MFSYNTAGSNFLGEIITRATGMPFLEYAQESLFGPLGIASASWEEWQGDPETTCAGGCLSITPRDILKIGQLLLQNGEWDGRSIVSKEWLEASFTPHAYVNEQIGYGYHWWLPSHRVPGTDREVHSIVAGGHGGQWLMIFPDRDLILVTTGGSFFKDDQSYLWIHRYFFPAIGIEGER